MVGVPLLASAQRRPGPKPRRHICVVPDESNADIPLNEGRGQNPGDTDAAWLPSVVRTGRSTKAGAKTPATRRRPAKIRAIQSRSTKAGAKTPATLVCDAFTIGFVSRSTKAGAKTPATQPGRSRLPWLQNRAQRRPGPKPRRHFGGFHVMAGLQVRSTKAGAKTPATRLPAAVTITFTG